MKNMKTPVWLIVFIISAFGISFGFSKGPNSSKIFESNLGYKISYPACSRVDVANGEESEKDPKDVDITLMAISKECVSGSYDAILGIDKDSPLEKNESMEDWIKKHEQGIERMNKANTSEKFLLTKRDLYKNIQFLKVSRFEDEIRIIAFANCGKKIFKIGFHRKIKDFDGDILNSLKEGKIAIPDIQRKVIESFDCTK